MARDQDFKYCDSHSQQKFFSQEILTCMTQRPKFKDFVISSPQIIDPYRFNLNEQKIATAHFNPQGVLIPKM